MPRKTIANSNKKSRTKKTDLNKGKIPRYLILVVQRELEEAGTSVLNFLQQRPRTVTSALVRAVHAQGHLTNDF